MKLTRRLVILAVGAEALTAVPAAAQDAASARADLRSLGCGPVIA